MSHYLPILFVVSLAFTGLLSACSTESELPLGDELDQLLNVVTATDVYEANLRDCVAAENASLLEEFDEWRLQIQRFERDFAVGRLDPTLESSGLAMLRLAEVRGEAPVAPEFPEASDSLREILYDPIERDGEGFSGCSSYAEAQRTRHPSEALRLDLQQRYMDDISSRFWSDPLIESVNSAWSQCMAEFGYPGLARPGDQLRLIEQQVDVAGNDEDKLSAALVDDRALTGSLHRCLEQVEWHERFSSLRQSYEKRYVTENRAQIERLLLLLDEEARSAQQSDG